MSHSGIKSTPGLHLLPSGYQGDESIEFPSEMSHNFGFVASTNSTSTTRHDQTLDLTVNFRESYPLINHSIYSSPEPVMYRKENCFVNQKGGDLNSAVNCTRTLIGPLGAIKLDSSNDLTGIGDHMDSLTQDNHSHDHQRYQGQHQRQYHIYTTQPSAQLLPVRFPPCEQVIQSELSIRPSFAWVLQLVYFGGWHAKIYMGAAMLGANCTTGMSCLMRREVLDRAGGLASFGQYLAEDYFISKAFYEEGWRVRIAHQPAWQNSPAPTVSQFHSRIFRWYQLRLAMLPQSAIAEPVTQCLTNGLICAFAWAHLCPGLVDPVVYLLVHLLIWFLLDYLMLSQMHPTYAHVSISKVEYLVAWFVNELMAIPLQIRALFSCDVEWRNRRYRIQWGGVTKSVGEPIERVTQKQLILDRAALLSSHASIIDKTTVGPVIFTANTADSATNAFGSQKIRNQNSYSVNHQQHQSPQNQPNKHQSQKHTLHLGTFPSQLNQHHQPQHHSFSSGDQAMRSMHSQSATVDMLSRWAGCGALDWTLVSSQPDVDLEPGRTSHSDGFDLPDEPHFGRVNEADHKQMGLFLNTEAL